MLSIIILGHNRVDISRQCLQSLHKHRPHCDFEIIFVDNASSDGTPDLANQFDTVFDGFRYIRNDENLSFSVANNRAASMANGRYLLFLNNDVTVNKSSLSHLLRPFETDGTVGVTGAKLLFPDTRKIQHAGIAYMLWGRVFNYGMGKNRSDGGCNEEKEMFAVTGAMLMVKRPVFEQVGGFEEQYHWGFEDVDLCLKVSQTGKRVLYVPSAESLHWESATLGAMGQANSARRNYRLFRARWGYLLEHKEADYMEALQRQGVRRVVIYGTGLAGQGLYRQLVEAGFDVAGFTSSFEKRGDAKLLGLRIYPLADVSGLDIDKIIVASQFFTDIENQAFERGIVDKLLAPVVW